VTDCPRPKCHGQVYSEPWEQNLWTCFQCARHFMRLDGELIEISRVATEQESEKSRAVGSKFWRDPPTKGNRNNMKDRRRLK